MSTDFTWFDPADGVRPDYRANHGRRTPSDPGGGQRGRPPSDRDVPRGRPAPPSRPAPPNRDNDRHATPPSYPIVAQHELDDPARRGPLGLLKRRELEDIPKIKPHEVLVWRVGSRYVIDRRELRAHDDTVVRASSVSVVSIRPETEVEVSFQIDSEDASEFTVKVTFICSVLDPVVVVRDGQVNAADALIAYLRGYQDLFNLGLEYPIREINKVRTAMALQVKSYMTLRPPKIPGIDVTSATVQIETPAVLSDLGKLTSEQEIELRRQTHEALLDSNRQDHILTRASKLDTVSHDPRAALGLAYADGGMASPELADRLQQMEESRLQRDRMDALAASARRHQLEDRYDQWNYEERQRTREERMAERQWERAQLESEHQDALEGRRTQINADIELLKIYAANGHLDTYNADIADVVRRIHGDYAGAQLAAEEKPELTDGQLPGSRMPEAGRDH